MTPEPPAQPETSTRDTQESPDGFRIVQIGEARLREAVTKVAMPGADPDPEAADRFLAYARSRHMDLDQCWAWASPDDPRVPLGPVCLALPNVGRTALLFTSPLTHVAHRSQMIQLLEHVLASLDRRRVALAQSLLTRAEKSMVPVYEASGFFQLANISYMECRLSSRRHGQTETTWPDDVRVEPYHPTQDRAFKQALAASYEETRDCPRLCGLRDLDDVFAGHKSAGDFDPRLWTLLRCGGKPAGVLLLSPIAEQGLMELSYIGIGPTMRGRGLGRRLLEWGLRQSVDHPETDRMVLAVDEANEPAVAMYRRFGFYRTDRRIAMVASVRDA